MNLEHNVTFAGTNPVDMVHRISHRYLEGEPDKFVIWQYQYGVPLSIQIIVNE